MRRTQAEIDRVEEQYQAVPDYIRENLGVAVLWAEQALADHEGSGHLIEITAQDGLCVCSFSKPEWAGDHSGTPSETGSEAIVRSVIEYLNGW